MEKRIIEWLEKNSFESMTIDDFGNEQAIVIIPMGKAKVIDEIGSILDDTWLGTVLS